MPFRPTDLTPFTVIKCPYQFEGAMVRKRFVVITHRGGYVICIKATSKMDRYASNDMANGVVIYKSGEIGCFTETTAIQPDNQFPISYRDLITHERNGDLEILGTLPHDFRPRLLKAMDNSITMSKRVKDRLLSIL